MDADIKALRAPGRHRHCRRGLTLVELLVVIGIIAILMGIILSIFFKAYQVVRSFR